VLWYAAPEAKDWSDKYVPQFESLTGIKVDLHPEAFDTIREKGVSDLTAHSKIYDVIYGPAHNIGTFYATGSLEPLDKYLADHPEFDLGDYLKPTIDLQARAHGHLTQIYGIPTYYGSILYYYRKDLIDDLDEKKAFKAKYGYELTPADGAKGGTYKQLRDIAEFFTRPDKGLYGMDLMARRGWDSYLQLFPFLYGYGADLMDDYWQPKKCTINTPQGVEALKMFVSLKRYCPPGVATHGFGELYTNLAAGKAAQAIYWGAPAAIVEDPEKSKVASPDKINFGRVPTGDPSIEAKTLFGGWQLYLSADVEPKRKEAGFEFMAWMQSKEMDMTLAAAGLGTDRVSTLQNPELQKKWWHFPALLDGAYHSKAEPQTELFAKIEEVATVYYTEAFAETMTVEKAVSTLEAELNATLATG